MKIIEQFKRLRKGSKFRLKFSKHIVDLYLGNNSLEYGIEISIKNGKLISKEYEKFILKSHQKSNEKLVNICAKVDNERELQVFAYLIEYVLFELGKEPDVTPSHIKKFIDDWLFFSHGRTLEIPIEKQIGLIGELQLLLDLVDEFPNSNQLNNWHGPNGSKIDFIFSNLYGIEVKSRIQPFKDWISISSVEQLDNDLENEHLIIFDYLPSDSGKTLKDFIDDLIFKLDNRDQINELIEKLRQTKFDYFTDYSNLKKFSYFRRICLDTKNNNFPFLKKSQEIRIDKIKYEINIMGLETINFKDTLAIVRSQQELY
jgi:hypothetical protein